jgi:serine/threonine protein kinase
MSDKTHQQRCHIYVVLNTNPCSTLCMNLQVYKGRRKCTGQITAMKFIVKHGKSEKDLKNLRQEIEILRQLRHENIIQMLDAFETKTDFCVVTGMHHKSTLSSTRSISDPCSVHVLVQITQSYRGHELRLGTLWSRHTFTCKGKLRVLGAFEPFCKGILRLRNLQLLYWLQLQCKGKSCSR